METKECIALLEKMVAIPSESQNEAQFAAFLEAYLRDVLGMESAVEPIEGKSCNVIGRWSNDAARRKLILGGHIDTVSPAQGWEIDPYRLTRHGDELHGLGAADMKGGLAAQLTVLKRLRDEKRTLDAEIEFVGLADEERYSIGAHAYVRRVQEKNTLKESNLFLMGEPHFDNIVIGATGKILLSLEVQGKKGHAATPEKGINAIDCMARLLAAVKEKCMPLYAAGNCASYCCLKIESDYEGYSLTIPARCRCLLNKQLLPTESVDRFIGDLQRLYAEQVGEGELIVRREIPNYPAYQLSPEQKDIQKLTRHLKKYFTREPELRVNQSVSDGNILYNELGLPTILFGPQGIGFHTEKEYLKVSSLAEYMEELYTYIITEYAV